jgi:glycerol-3-phosphate acyltransferase PlsY
MFRASEKLHGTAAVVVLFHRNPVFEAYAEGRFGVGTQGGSVALPVVASTVAIVAVAHASLFS